MLKAFCCKMFILSLIFILFPSLICAFQNEPDSFRGIKWGNNISESPDMGIVEDGGDSKYYIKKNDKMKIGDAELERVVYGFYKGRFYFVLIEFKGLVNYLSIKETFQQLYGEGYRPNRFMEEYVWFGSTVDISLEYKEILKKGTAIYFFKPIIDEKKADMKEKAKKGSGDL